MAEHQSGFAQNPWTDYRRLLSLSVPVFIGSISSILLGLVDVALMGRHSVPGLASVSAGAAVLSLITSVILAATMTHQILAAKRFGANHPVAVGSSFWHTLLFAGGLGLLALVLIWAGGPWLAKWMGNSEAVHTGMVAYLRARSPEVLLIVPTALLRMTFSADKNTKWGMYTSFVVNGANIIYNYPLIFGLGAVPSLGATGSGLATTLANATGLLFLLGVAHRQRLFARIKPETFSIKAEELRLIQKMSLPAMGSALFDYLANLLLFALVATVGAAHLAASRIAFNLDMMLFSIAMSLATGCQILVGRSWGAQELPRALHYLRLNRRLMLAVLCVIAVPLVVWPEGVMRLFTSFDDVQKAGANALRLIGLSAPFIAWACSNVSALRALGRTTADMYTNVLPVWVLQLPLGWICGAWLGWGLYGVYIGFIAYWISRAVLAQVLVRRAIHEEIAGVAA